MRFNSIPCLWNKALRLPLRRRLLLIEAVVWLVSARLVVALVPFPRIAHHLGQLHPPSKAAMSAQPVQPIGKDCEIAAEIAWAIDRATRFSPFPILCLPRALAAWKMLHRRGVPSRIHFGASHRQEAHNLLTHAWIDACGVKVSGFPEADNCIELGYFAH
jgi:hypothetical protein